jgi:hypothetical protein
VKLQLPKKKDRVITLRMNEDSFKIVEDYANNKGLSVSAYINSIVDSYAEWFIPLASNEKVSIPKKALYSLFSYASKDSLDDFVKEWAIELKHGVRLLYGELNLQTSLYAISKISKYFMGVDARIISTTKNSKDVGDDDNNNKKGQSLIVDDDDDYKNVSSNSTFWIVIRHNLGENYSYFWNKMFLEFFAFLQSSVDVITEYDETTISIRLKEK